MENAAKALLIAGGMLLAIIIITMFMMMYNQIKSMEQAKEEQLQMQQLATFNAQYEAYNKKIMYGTDVITLFNKVKENNLNNPSEQITLNIPTGFRENVIKLENGELNELDKGDLLKLRFICKGILYASTGKVSEITIEESK